MKISKYFNIDPNVLIEYIYDDSNLIGEPYNILYNTRNGLKCFISGDEVRPTPRGYKQTNNDLYNQLYKIDNIQGRYGKLPISGSNKIDSDNYSFLQLRNFATSIPIRYDTIKVHIPVDSTFGDYKGFHLRAYTYDFDNTKVVELSNFFFNITDVEQNYKLEYSSPVQIINEKQWGKYVKIQIPATTKVSDQRVFNVTRENSINYNLTDGLGLSKNSPVFLDFYFINSVDTVNGSKFFNLSSKTTVVVPQTPEFEKLGVKIEESTQGDFFLIYGTYNGNIAEFENFIDDAYYAGNRYHAEFQVDLFEKNVKTKSNTFILNEDFGEEIEYRPVLKFTTTTAIVDVTLRLVDSVDGTFIERKASYGMLQGGGAKMGSEPNTRLNTANGTGGAGDISKYSKNLTKINLRNAKKKEVYNIKSTILPNVGDSPFGTKAILKLKKLPFNLFSSNYYFINDNDTATLENIQYIPNNKSIVYLYPFDNIINLKIIEFVGVGDSMAEFPYDLTKLENLKLTIKSDKKDLDFEIYKDSSENDLENGKVVFKIGEGKYQDIKKISNSGYDLFYVNGIDENGVKQIVYSSFFLPWDSVTNIRKIESDYLANQKRITQVLSKPAPKDLTANVLETINSSQSIPKGINTNPIDSAANQDIKNGSGFSGSSFTFKPRWNSIPEAIELGSDKKNYVKPNDTKQLAILLSKYGILGVEKIGNSNKTALEKRKKVNTSGFSSSMLKPSQNLNNIKLNLVLGYFKGLNLEPINAINFYYKEVSTKQLFTNKIGNIDAQYYKNLKDDLNDYINSGLSNKRSPKGIGLRETEVKIGEFLPKSKKDIDLIKKNKIFKTNPSNKPAPTKTPPTSNNVDNDTIDYPSNQDIPRGGRK
jgi:hypothetical protein